MNNMKITMAHGGGGKLTRELIHDVFEKHFGNDTLGGMEDAAVLTLPSSKIAFTTDSFVVTPLFFPGGDIGRMSVCGTVNDLLMRGALPMYLSAGFILETGLDIETLDRVAASMGETAREAGVEIVAGDTKVVEGGGGLYINTSGIGAVETDLDIGAGNAADGDAVILSGHIGNHHACILSARMGVANGIRSDCAPLTEMTAALLAGGVEIHAMRDVTRGGLATALHEIATASGIRVVLADEESLADDRVRGFCDILGLDPLYMGNEGKLVLLLPGRDAKKAVDIIRGCKYGEFAQIIGEAVPAGAGRPGYSEAAGVFLRTRAGGTRIIGPLIGEGLPRIC